MRAIALRSGTYSITECAKPVVGTGDVLIRVAYAGVNRADLLQKQGHYPLPEGKPAIPGMEVSGEIVACGKDVKGLKVGAKVCALLRDGGFAEYVAVPAPLVLAVPKGMDMDEAAALPEACCTAWISLIWQGKLQAGESVLIHRGASGIGTIAIQIAKHMGARVFATAGSQEKCIVCTRLGAHTIAYKEEDFAEAIRIETVGMGVDVILDMVGGDYLQRNLASLAHGGRLCIIAFQQGAKSEVNMGPVLLKHLSIMGSTLRSRPLEEKAKLIQEVQKALWKPLAEGALKPVTDQIFPLEQAEVALARMEQGLNVGKILLKM